jgi:hypothetical protein
LLSSVIQGPVWLTGGTVGPEGSVFLFVVVGLLWFAFDRVYPEAKYSVPTALGAPERHSAAHQE